MKKFLITILAFLYLSTSSGAMVHMHYCMGKLVDKNFWANEDQHCGSCGMDKSSKDSDNCCKEEVKQLKVDKEHGPAQQLVFQMLSPDDFIVHELRYLVPAFSSITEDYPLSNAPPSSGVVDIYKQIRVFRI